MISHEQKSQAIQQTRSDQLLPRQNRVGDFAGPVILMLPTQRLEPRFRLLDSCGGGLRIEILRSDRIAPRPISSPFGKDQWIIGFCEREVRLSATHLEGALQHN